MRDFLVSEISSPMMQSKMERPPSNLQSEHSEVVWVTRCPYPLVGLGLKTALEAAGYDVHSGQKCPVVGEDTPSCVIYCPTGPGVVQEVNRLQELVPDAPVLILGLNGSNLPLARAALQAGARGFLHLEM